MGIFNKAKKDDDTKEVDKHDLSLAELSSQKSASLKANATEKEVKHAKEDTGRAYRVLLKPLITEKGTYLAVNNKYLFAVWPDANKQEIKKAIKAVYGVMPIKVNIINTIGKEIRHGKTKGMTSDTKKAVVTLPKGQTIQVYEGV